MMEKGKKRIQIKLILAIVAAALVIAVIVMLATGKSGSLKRSVSGLLGGGKTEFYYSSGSDTVFAGLDEGLAVVSSSSVQTYNKNGKESLSENMLLISPSVASYGDIAVAYDMGGTSFKVFNTEKVIYSVNDTANDIISASINADGWVALCTQEDNYKGLVTIYNAEGELVYKWYSGEGYLLSANVSPDNDMMAALVLTDSGSKVVFYKLNSEDIAAQYDAAGRVLMDVKFLSESRAECIGSDMYALVNTANGEVASEYDYTDKFLNNYSFESSKFTAIVINDFQVGYYGKIVTLGANGSVIAELENTEQILSVSASGNYLAVLYSDRLVVYNSSLEVCDTYDNIGGSCGVIAREDGSAIVLDSYSAVVYG